MRYVDVLRYEDESKRTMVEITYEGKTLVIEPAWINPKDYHHRAIKRYFNLK